MIRGRSKRRGSFVRFGHYHFENMKHGAMIGYGDGDYIRLRDEFGNEWTGTAEKQSDDTIRFRFRDANGRYATGVGDYSGITLRDDKGKTWRGFVD